MFNRENNEFFLIIFEDKYIYKGKIVIYIYLYYYLNFLFYQKVFHILHIYKNS
jgi:hypothetical protein